MTVKPDFVVVGAPKCGTTSIHELLDSTNVVDVVRKEPDFFGRDLQFSGRRMSEAEYTQLFSAPTRVPIGDISVWYLYSEEAAAEIAQWNPAAKIIIMLRNPVDQMCSMHSQALFTRDETEPSFEHALELETLRRRGEDLPPRPSAAHAVMYREIANYPPQIERYLARFDRSHVHFIVLEDLRSSPVTVWTDLLRFLGAKVAPLPPNRSHNPNKVHRSHAVSLFTNDLPRYLFDRYDLRRSPRPLKALLLSGRRKLVDWNRRYQSRLPIDPQLRSSLVEEFVPVVSDTERLLGRSLPSWRN